MSVSEKVKDQDVVSRSVFKPKDYALPMLARLDLTRSFSFSRDQKYCESVNCHRLLRNNTKKLHELGFKKQDRDNARKQADSKPADREYTGFAPAVVGKIREINVEQVSFDVEHSPTKENKAHCDIVMNFEGRQEGKKPITAHRTLAIEFLCECFGDLVSSA